jgi:hypothetical protein
MTYSTQILKQFIKKDIKLDTKRRETYKPSSICEGQYTDKAHEPGESSQYIDWLQTGRLRGRSSSPVTVQNFLFSTSKSALGSNQIPIPGGKAAGT